MKLSLGIPIILASLTLLRGAEMAAPLQLSQLPPAVQAAAKQQLAGSVPVDIEKHEEEDGITYTITRKIGNEERYFVLDDSGKLVAQEIGPVEAPPAVQKSLRQCVGEGTLTTLEKSIDGTEITYEADFTRKDGAERSATIAIDGRVASLEIGVDELPPAVKKSMDEHLRGGVVQAVYRNYESSVISFQIDFDKGGASRDMIISADGKMETLELALKDLPAAAQKTVRQKVGNGKIIYIDKSFEKRNGVEPFEIEATKDGKPLNFSVAPRGRFLGMD